MMGIVIALGAASFWRKWGEDWISQALKWAGISHSDRYISAWQSVIVKSRVGVNNLLVRKTDGSVLKSENIGQFSDLPFGACVLGDDGSVAMYVTHHKGKGETNWSDRDPSEYMDWGAKITIIPASAVSEIDYRAC